MNYDFRTRSGPSPHDAQIPMYRAVSSSSPSPTSSSAAAHPMYGQPMYPNINQQGHAAVPPVGRPAPYHQTSTASPPCKSLHLAPYIWILLIICLKYQQYNKQRIVQTRNRWLGTILNICWNEQKRGSRICLELNWFNFLCSIKYTK